MDNTVDLRESSPLDPTSKLHHDLGLTLHPGSQPQLSVPCSNDEDVDDLASLFDMDDGFDPFTDFGKLAHQTDSKDGSKKRTSDVAFEGDLELSPSKKENQEQQSVSVAAETITQLPEIQPPSGDSIRSIPSHSPFLSSEVPVPASSTIKNTFKLNQESLARIAAVEAFTQGKSSTKHISPYAPVGYYPSAPNLHCVIGRETDSNEALQSRLDSSRRRLNVVIAERNKYRDALLKYEQMDPETGMLGIQKLEAENIRLRRLVSNHRYRMDQLKADVQEWKDRYTAVATTHNCLIRDYQTLQATTCRQPSAVEAPTEATFTSPQGNHPEGSYEQLSHAFKVLFAAYVGAPIQPSNLNSSAISPASPLSISSPTEASRAATQPFKAPTPHCEASADSDTCSPPTLSSPTILRPTLTEDRPTDLPSTHLEDLPPNLRTPLSSHSPPGERTTMATNYCSSTFSGRRGYVPPISPEQAAILLQQAGIAYKNPAGYPDAAHQATGPAMTTTLPPAAAAAITTTKTTATPSAPTVPPKDIVVIDLTGDSDTEVSPQGSISQSSNPPLTQECSPLTEFRRRFRKKLLTWLHESNGQTDVEAADALRETLNSRKRKRDLDPDFVETTWDECYSHVQGKKVLSSGSPCSSDLVVLT
jgi:hypothetical protein